MAWHSAVRRVLGGSGSMAAISRQWLLYSQPVSVQEVSRAQAAEQAAAEAAQQAEAALSTAQQAAEAACQVQLDQARQDHQAAEEHAAALEAALEEALQQVWSLISLISFLLSVTSIHCLLCASVHVHAMGPGAAM